MRLMTIAVEGYRRFENAVKVDVASDVVALVGPNEAGKSTLLAAMLSLETSSGFSPRERSRDSSSRISITCSYVLDDNDREAISDICGGKHVRWWTYEKRQDGQYFRLHPEPKRDLQHRIDRAETLKRFLQSEPLDAFSREGESFDSNGESLDVFCRKAISALLSSKNDLNREELGVIHSFAEIALGLPVSTSLDGEESDVKAPSVSEEFHIFVEDLNKYEEGLDPHTEAGRRLVQRRPKFIMFSADDRELRTTYDLDEVADSVPAALDNLAQLARLDLRQLLEASKAENRSLRARLIDEANAVLQDVFSKSWNQEAATVHLQIQGTVLELLVTLPGGGYSEIEERSEGLRWFVALRAFMDKYDLEVPPILLVDEAETHLHYDAQADLVNLFTIQELASKIIYTTHSAGCLPRDLGNGIRAVVPLRATERSTVRNSVWVDSNAGFSPLVYAMGATTFAFLPARNVLIAEGLTDAMLYPTLFREAARQRTLAFQVAPGLAVAAPARMLGLTHEGGVVAFIADGDEEGQKYQRALKRQGVSQDHIFGLDQIFGNSAELEDLILPEHFCAAVNHLISTYQNTSVVLDPSSIPSTGRIAAFKAWCESNGVKVPEKPDIAQYLLDMKSTAEREGAILQLLDPRWEKKLERLCRSIDELFRAPVKA